MTGVGHFGHFRISELGTIFDPYQIPQTLIYKPEGMRIWTLNAPFWVPLLDPIFGPF